MILVHRKLGQKLITLEDFINFHKDMTDTKMRTLDTIQMNRLFQKLNFQSYPKPKKQLVCLYGICLYGYLYPEHTRGTSLRGTRTVGCSCTPSWYELSPIHVPCWEQRGILFFCPLKRSCSRPLTEK